MKTCTYRWCQIKEPQLPDQFITFGGRETKFCQSCRNRRKGYEQNALRRAGIEPKQYGGYARKPIEQLKSPYHKQQRRREEQQHLLEEQNYKCAICSTDISDSREAHLDHCHTSEKPRAWLCRKCNTGLGFFLDNAELLQKAIDYLRRYHV